MDTQDKLSILMMKLGILTASIVNANKEMCQIIDEEGVDVADNKVSVPKSVAVQFLNETQSTLEEITPLIKQVRSLCDAHHLDLPSTIPALEQLVAHNIEFIDAARASCSRVH